MSQRYDYLAAVMFQAAVAVGHHACSNPITAIREGVRRTMDASSLEASQAYDDARKLYTLLYGHVWGANYFDTDGPSWKMWLSNHGRHHMVMTLLFAYEFIVTEMSGGRIEIPQIVTPCNANQTDVHSTSDVV